MTTSTELPPLHQHDPNESLTHFQKVNLANQLRLMGDSQRVLDSTNRRAKLFAQWESEKVLGQRHEDAMAGDDEMKISIDSPEIHHNYPPAAPAKGMSTFAKLAAIGLAATGVGIPAAVGLAMAPAIIKAWQGEPAKQPSGNLLNDYDLFVGEPE